MHRVKAISGIIIVFVLICCGITDIGQEECECFELTNNVWIPFIGIDEEVSADNCEYYLMTYDIPPKSKSINKRLCFTNKTLKIKAGFPFEKYDIIHQGNDTIGTIRTFLFSEKIKYDCFDENCYENSLIRVRLVNKIMKYDKIIKILEFHNFKYRGVEELTDLVLTVFFNDKDGFVGTYMYQSFDPTKLISARGDILRDVIDYSDYSFYKLQ